MRKIKILRQQCIDGGSIKSDERLYYPNSQELKANIAEAIENWHNIQCDPYIQTINLSAKSGVILELYTKVDDYNWEIWKIIPYIST